MKPIFATLLFATMTVAAVVSIGQARTDGRTALRPAALLADAAP